MEFVKFRTILGSLGAVVFLFIPIFLSGCGHKENLTSLYPAVPYSYSENFDADITSQIPMTVVKPSLMHRITGLIFGWLPVVGDILELPIDLTTALIPSIKDVSHPQIPGASQITDPQTLSQIASVTIADGFLNIVPENQRGPDYKPDQCWFSKCKEVGFTFLDEVRIYIAFERVIPNSQGHAKSETVTVLIGDAVREKDYDEKKQILHFEMTGEDLKPYFQNYPNYKINLVADAHLPDHAVYIAGTFTVHVSFQLDDSAKSTSAR
jgi:hypothetical protein